MRAKTLLDRVIMAVSSFCFGFVVAGFIVAPILLFSVANVDYIVIGGGVGLVASIVVLIASSVRRN